MATLSFEDTKDVYWKYYISLEEQFIETKKYVEFDKDINSKTYSMEYLKLFQAVCSEIDVIGKVLAENIDGLYKPSKKTGINEWWYFATKNDNTLCNRTCKLLGKYVLQPWKNYVVVKNKKPKAKKYILDNKSNPRSMTPMWWNDYNTVKHERTGKKDGQVTNYTKANLGNLFLAFSALFILEVKLMEVTYKKGDERIQINDESRLFDNELPYYTTLLSVN